MNLPECVLGTVPIAQLRMNQVGKQFHAIHDARAGPGEVRAGAHSKNTVMLDGGQIVPARLLQQLLRLLGRLFDTEATGRHNQDFRRRRSNLRPLNADGIRSFMS